MQRNKSKSAASLQFGQEESRAQGKGCLHQGPHKEIWSSTTVRLRKGSKTPKGRKCTEAFAHFLTSLARKNKLVGQVVLGGLLGSCSC